MPIVCIIEVLEHRHEADEALFKKI